MAERTSQLLVADDNKVNRLLLARNLELQGHRVSLAENGRIALEKLQQDPFDLVLLDMEMPEMTGFEVLAHVQKSTSLRDIPIIVTSSLEGEAHVVRCLELGAEDVLKKPVNSVILRARVNSSLEKKRLRDQQKALVRRFAAHEVAQDLEREGFALRGQRIKVTVMFVDLRGFTTMSEQHSPEEIIELLNTYYTLMFEAIGSHGGVVNQIIGDGLMALFGAPRPLEDAALRAARCAQEMLEMLEMLNVERERAGSMPLRIGVGIATGDVVAGYTGTQDRATYTCVGDAVNVAARLESHTKEAGRAVLCDEETVQAMGGEIPDGVQPESGSLDVTISLPEGQRCEPLGPLMLKGKARPVQAYALGAS